MGNNKDSNMGSNKKVHRDKYKSLCYTYSKLKYIKIKYTNLHVAIEQEVETDLSQKIVT